jgi:heat shock protein HspQ
VRHRCSISAGWSSTSIPVFANSEEWYEAIPEAIRRPRNSPSTICSPRNAEQSYIAYVSQQNLMRTKATSRSIIPRSPLISTASRTAATP